MFIASRRSSSSRATTRRHVFATLLAAALAGCALSHSGRTPDVAGPDASDVRGDTVLDVLPDTPIDTMRPDTATCPAGQQSCNGTCVSTDDVANCGACGNDCTALFGVVASAVHCSGGTCSIAGACQPRYADCVGGAADGCETDISLPAHCGACATTCTAAAPMCNAAGSSYACATGCSGATSTLCSGACVDVTADPMHCNGCGMACPTTANGRATCTASVCGLVCDAGYHRCGDHCAANDSTLECGASCTSCATMGGAVSACNAGTCAITTCPAGTANCDGNIANGCETDIRTTSNCGACGMACSVANGTAACNSGTCAIQACNAGFGDCANGYADGCETPTNTVARCGSCTMVCMPPNNGSATCTAGTCGISCNSGYSPSGSTCVRGLCGNGVLDGAETCDDGNNMPNDGCSASCQLETATAADNCPATLLIVHRGTLWYTGTTVGATNNSTCSGSGNGADRVYELVTADAGNVVVELVPTLATYDPVLRMLSGVCPGMTEQFCVASAGVGQPEIIRNATTTAGARYTLIVDGTGSSTPGTYSLRITIN